MPGSPDRRGPRSASRRSPALTIAVSAMALLASSVSLPAAYAVPSPEPVSRIASAAAPAARPYPATPPSGIRCRAATLGTATYTCVIGRSVEGRDIVAARQGNPDSRRVLVVSGQMHGEEWPGPLAVDRIRKLAAPADADYQIWTVRSINPDGGRIGRRVNSRGVNLNLNFPDKFRPGTLAGRRALSEPESRAMARFLRWVQPDLVISLHGFSESVDIVGGGRRAAWARAFSSISRIRPPMIVPCNGPCHGNMTDWYSRVSTSRGVAFTVEMPRSSRVVRGCAVPGRPARATPIRCVAWAAKHLAGQLPD